jgi:hypothetical protein
MGARVDFAGVRTGWWGLRRGAGDTMWRGGHGQRQELLTAEGAEELPQSSQRNSNLATTIRKDVSTDGALPILWLVISGKAGP